jgi:molybdate transport system substrate-binding protein
MVGLPLISIGCATGGTEVNARPVSGHDIRQVELVVFAASSLTDAFERVVEAFERENPGVQVLTNYGGSSQLAVQLVEGAQADVFASANERQMDVAIQGERIAGDPVQFARNRLTVIVPHDNPGQIVTLRDLANPGVLLVLAVPGVPIRTYADDLVDQLALDEGYGPRFRDGFYQNLVSEEKNVRTVVARVALGEADAGVVYSSDVTPQVAARVLEIPIPVSHGQTAVYPVGIVAGAPQPVLAQRFVDFLLSPKGQEILAASGFLTASGL